MKANNPHCVTSVADVFIHRHAATAMREIRRLASTLEQATDEMLQAACYLSMTARPRCYRYGRVGGLGFGLFRPPLQKLQALDMHGETYFAEPHLSAARRMVGQRGGLREVHLVGFAEALQW